MLSGARRSDRFLIGLLAATGLLVIAILIAIIAFVGRQGLLTFKDVGIFEFFFTTKWAPSADASGQYGALVFLIGSVLATGIALLLAWPVGLACAIFMAKVAPAPLRRALRIASDLFVGIPSVIYGYIGVAVLVPWVQRVFGGSGYGLLVSGVILAIMVMPTIISVAEDALRSLPAALEEASLGLGATRWQTIRRVLLPAARPGILTGVILAFGRAFGETTAVQMVVGNSPLMPHNLWTPTATLTGEIMLDMGQTMPGSTWNNALFLMALGLLLNSLLTILLVRRLGKGRVAKA